MFHAVLPEKGDQEGALALFLPRAPTHRPLMETQAVWEAVVVGRERTLDPGHLYALLIEPGGAKPAPPLPERVRGKFAGMAESVPLDQLEGDEDAGEEEIDGDGKDECGPIETEEEG